MAEHNDFGKLAEEQAVIFLKQNHYLILARNWYWQKAENRYYCKKDNHFITGATSGIGKAAATRLAGENYRLILCGRRKEILEELAGELAQKTDVYTLTFDVRNYEEVQNAVASLPAEWQAIDILINNAGNAHGLNRLTEGKVSDWDMMMDGNVKGLLYVSRMHYPPA
ncbi:hypothetical protein FQR65_LT16995 [Abscondita terminalis]|nr:hypothetical protein FQR65_LT16995 [Abscondita terminalis]